MSSLRPRQLIGVIASAAVVVGTVAWVASGSELPVPETQLETVIEAGEPQPVSLGRKLISKGVPGRVRFDGRSVAVERLGGGARLACLESGCVLVREGVQRMLVNTGPAAAKTLRRAARAGEPSP